MKPQVVVFRVVRPLVLRLVLMGLVLLGGAGRGAWAAGADETAGVVLALHRPASWRAGPHGAVVPLDPRKDRYRRLRPGDQLRCGQGGRLDLEIYGERVGLKESPAWYPILPVPGASELTRRAMEEYGRTGGLTRAGQTAVWSPAPQSVADPRSLVLRWTPLAAGHRLSLAVAGAGRAIVWRQEGVPAAAGVLDSASLRQVLAARTDPTKWLTLSLRVPGERPQTLRFRLLSPADQAALPRDLAVWDRQPGFLRCLGRASVFERYGLSNAVAAEFEAALAGAPDSRDLLAQTLAAERGIGNTVRAQELKRRLAALR